MTIAKTILVADDDLELDAPVGTYLPELGNSPDNVGAQLTLRQLLSHTSGLADGPGSIEMAAPSLRRFVLDKLRRGELDGSDALLQMMDDIYGLLVTIDYPDALTGGLRRTTDATRGILERTRGDLTFALRQRDLEVALTRVERQIQARLGTDASVDEGTA